MDSQSFVYGLLTTYAWPITALAVALVLRGRLPRVDTKPNWLNHIKKLTFNAFGILGAEVELPQQLPAPLPTNESKPAAIPMSASANAQAAIVKGWLTQKPEQEHQEFLYTELVHTRVFASYEQVFNRIWMSQYVLIDNLNSSTLTGDEIHNVFYAPAAAQKPAQFASYPFQAWLQWLVDAGLVAIVGVDQYTVTQEGREFLAYCVNAALDRSRLP